MRFSLSVSHHPWMHDPTGDAPSRTLQTARAADDGGIDGIWATEDTEGWDAFAVLSAIATVTSRASLGIGVTSPYARHPNTLAASIASLDRLSGGRTILGLGRGQVEWYRDALGVETGKPLAALTETIALLRGWWQPPYRVVSAFGDHFQVRDWERSVHPRQERVPIYLAAAGPRAQALAGTVGDGVIFNALTSVDVLRNAIPGVRDAAAAAGRDPATLAFVLWTGVTVTDDPETERKALDRGKTALALINALPGMDRLVQTQEFDVAGILREVRAVMRTDEILAQGGGFPALRREGNLAAARAAIPDALIRHLGIIGSLPAARARLRELEALGVTEVCVTPPPDATSIDAWRTLLRSLRA